MIKLLAMTFALLVLPTLAQATPSHRSTLPQNCDNNGRCFGQQAAMPDGPRSRGRRAYGRLGCGKYMSALLGIPYTPVAKDFARKYPHTYARVGAVVVQHRKGRDASGRPGGHVSRIVTLLGPCRAIVNDNAGTYERDICKGLIAYVDPRG